MLHLSRKTPGQRTAGPSGPARPLARTGAIPTGRNETRPRRRTRPAHSTGWRPPALPGLVGGGGRYQDGEFTLIVQGAARKARGGWRVRGTRRAAPASTGSRGGWKSPAG